ncbi:MAG: sulfite oxidase heme-binding subunit YedZ [Vicinamibacterales bacterium]
MSTKVLKVLICIAGLLPAGALVAGAFTDNLGANPIELITHETGTSALTFLVVTLSVTPIRRLTGWHEVIRVRRMLGLFAFFYACLHFLIWFVFDHTLNPRGMVDDVMKRPYITVGMAGLLMMIPLALTSTAAMIRRLGRRWRMLHRLTYGAAVAGVVHFWWLVKADLTEPQRWAAALTVLFGLRAWWMLRRRYG